MVVLVNFGGVSAPPNQIRTNQIGELKWEI